MTPSPTSPAATAVSNSNVAAATAQTHATVGADSASPAPILEAINLCKEYDRGDVVALKNANLQVFPGEFVAIMGPSGSGKSTLLHLLGTLDLASSGTVRIKGRDVAQVRQLHVLRAQFIGFIFQLHNLIPSLPLLENAMVPLVPLSFTTRQKREKAAKALDLVGLSHRAHHTPGKVSGGERQRAAFARALVNDPELILADEPTGSVDSKTGERLLELLLDFKRNRRTTLVIVTHNPEIALHADRVIIIRDGELSEFPKEKMPTTTWRAHNPFLAF